MIPGVKNANAWNAVLIAAAIGAAALFFARTTTNPPGFYIDESSIAYNAHTLAQQGCDENGVPWPLYFRAFGDYKNPVYIYLVAALFKVTGPSILGPRLLSAALGVLAALVLARLAFRLERSRIVALLVLLFVLITPWLFEVSRVAMEVALYPVACGLFLFSIRCASEKEKWNAAGVVSIAATLALLTYAYSIGRLFAPLLAVGLAFFWSRERRIGIIATWLLYGALVLPVVAFSIRHPGALSERFNLITYLNADAGLGERVFEFAKHYLRNLNPWRLLVRGDPNRDQIAHVFGLPLFLAPIFVFSVAGFGLAVRQAKSDAWSRFLLYGFAVAIVPASLTKETLHMLRLIAAPVFLLVFAIEGVKWFIARWTDSFWRAAFIILLALTVVEAGWFQWNYQRTAHTARRVHLFDAEYPSKIFEPAIAANAHPIYIADALWIPGYIQAYWYGTLNRVDLCSFRRRRSERS